jgi:hypothetical protein
MHRILILLLLLLFAVTVWAQETDGVDSKSSDTNAVEAAEDAVDDADEEQDDSDELYADEDEDVFIPSENVKFGQSIPFPTDI